MINYLVGLDGGGTGCRARLQSAEGVTLAEATGGPANLYQHPDHALKTIKTCIDDLYRQAGLPDKFASETGVALGLAGAEIESSAERLRLWQHPWARLVFANDAHVACLGAHKGADGGLVAVGTGIVGYAITNGQGQLFDGWGFPLADQGSGAWLGQLAVRAMLRAWDGMAPESPLTRRILSTFANAPRTVPDWAKTATSRDYAHFARWVVEAADEHDPVAQSLLDLQASEVAILLRRVKAQTSGPVVLTGGLAPFIATRLPDTLKAVLVAPKEDAVAGSLYLLRADLAEEDHNGPNESSRGRT